MTTFALVNIKMRNITQWALTLLFIGYVSSISFFTHTHVVKKVTYVHSHPFQKGDHTHTDGQFLLLHQFFHTTITSAVVPEFDLSAKPTQKTAVYPNYKGLTIQLTPENQHLSRAPPAAA